MTTHEISGKTAACPLCRRPKWDGNGGTENLCDAESGWTGAILIVALSDCRTRALSIAALVAPVVEAARGAMSDRLTIDPDGFNELVAHDVTLHIERLDRNLLHLIAVKASGERYRFDIAADSPVVVIEMERPAVKS